MQQLITSAYEHNLARIFHGIDNRGLAMNVTKLANLRGWCNTQIGDLCAKITQNTGTPVYVGAANKPPSVANSVNINYSPSLQKFLKNLGFTLPKIRKKDKDTHAFEMKDSANKLVLQKVLADPNLWPASSTIDAAMIIKSLLEVHGIAKVRGTYVNARLHDNTYFCNYSVTSTLTGRRGSKKHIFNLGNNAQNFPKHSELGSRFRECIISRPGKLFLFVDQVSAEDWPVQALAENFQALEEMRRGVNRHYRFASLIFGIPELQLREGRANHDQSAEIYYYLGKKSRHANNYRMRATTMSEALAAEGYSFGVDACKLMLEKVNAADPNVANIFHTYIEREIFNNKFLKTPFGRERQFFGLRPNDKNWDIINEACAWIPQSLIGDNTGLAITYIDNYFDSRDYIVNDGHDSICQEIPDNFERLREVFNPTRKAFDRTITFHNGIEINIPIEAELGYTWNDTVKLGDLSEDGLKTAYYEVKQKKEATDGAKVIKEAVAGSLP
jgi:hypothetical protein